jgi:nitroimidazol reductase NimA-like FMN-containing flavoprotein (pyridoxamine 5'-phosphate oxidase superfamily)/RimJ/RimL family protein N-acetyltransferase
VSATTTEYLPTPRTTPTRLRERARYDAATVHAILDEALVCHLGFTVDGAPRVLPTLHVRVGGTLYLHGSTGSRPLRDAGRNGLDVCVTVTLVDGLVLARSAFNHSMNYRSVVAHGRARVVTDPAEKSAALTALVEHVARGRSADSRPPSAKELAATSLLALELADVSAKVRAGQSGDDAADLDLPHWAGVLPLRTVAGAPQPVPGLGPVPTPAYLADYRRGADPNRSPWLEPVPLTGRHVRLEPLGPEHVDGLLAAGADPEVWRWLSHPQPRTRAAMAQLVSDALHAQSRGERVVWVQRDAATGAVAGTTSYYDVFPAPRRQLAIGHTWLGRPWWRTPLNTEAKLLLLERAFDTLGALRVTWHTDLRNERSQAAIARLGAVREGVLRHDRVRPDGTLRDTVVFGMTADEWPAAAARLRARPGRHATGGTAASPVA